jgi:phospholipid transport system substrate-binding protein
MRGKFFVGLGVIVFLLGTVLSYSISADSGALGYLKTHIASLQQILTDQNLAGKQQILQRRKLVREILEKLFDFGEMARRALGANGRRYQDRMGEFTPLFVDLLEHAYMGELEENGDAKIQYGREIIAGDKIVEIDTKTRLRDGSEYSVDYKLLLSPAGWRVFDVIVGGVSLVENYRSQFDRVLSRKSFDELLQDMREKQATVRLIGGQ